MPIYDYHCVDCGATYDVFHKVREVKEDVVCPSCGSMNAQRLIGRPNVAMSGGSARPSNSGFEAPDCAGGCCGGSCGLD